MAQIDDLWKERGDDTTRLVNFSDAVFAVALTLLVIGLRVPQVQHGSDLLGKLASEVVPSLAALFISFVVISSYWRTHHRLFNHIARYDSTLVTLNFAFLLGIILQPFTTELLSQYGNVAIAVALYAGLLGVTMLLLTGMRAYATRAGLMRAQEMDMRRSRFSMLRTLIPSLLFLVTAGLAFIITPWIVPFLWLLVIPAHWILERVSRGSANASTSAPAAK